VETPLHHKVAELESLLRALPDLYFRLANDGTILDYHADALSNLYLAPEDFLNKRIQDILPPARGRQFLKAMKELKNNGPVVRYDYSLTIIGQNKYYEATLTPLGSQQVIAIVRDITDRMILADSLRQIRKSLEERVEQRTAELSVANQSLQCEVEDRRRAENLLRKSEARFHRLFENAADAIYLHDQEGRLIDVNHKACEATGYTRDELLQMAVWDFDASHTRQQCIEICKRVVEDQQQNSFKLASTHRRKNGSIFPVETQIAKIEFQNQILILGLVRDMTEHKKAQAILQNARNELEQRVEQRTAELSSANVRLQQEITERKRLEKAIADRMTDEQRAMGQALHDGLAQQLTGTAMLTQTFHTKLKASSSPLAASALELAQLINDARDQVRLLINGLCPVEVDVDGLKTALQKLATSTEQLYGITCVFEYVGPLDIQEKNTATQLYYITREALNNAVKHAKPTKIVIGVMADGRHSIFYVRDNGIGFDTDPKAVDGMGLKIMNYRAGLVGAVLKIHRLNNGGTLVACTL